MSMMRKFVKQGIGSLAVMLAMLVLGTATASAQCPTVAATEVFVCDAAGGGEITVDFSNGTPANHQNYGLFDVDNFTYVSQPFGTVTKTYNSADSTLVFGGIPDGSYAIADITGTCPAIFDGFNPFDVDGTNELTAAVNTITHDCAPPNSGAIDIDVTGGTAPYSYSWTGPTAIGDTQDPTGLTSGSYSVTVTDADFCTTTISNIDVNPTPTANDVNAGGACIGSVVDLTANEGAVNGGGGITYSYFEDAATTTAIGDPTAVTINSDTTFFVLVDDSFCTDTAAISYTVLALPTANDVAAGPLCPGSVVDLTGNEAAINGGAVTYSYFEEASLTTAIGDPTNVTINTDTAFFVLVDDGACTDTAQISYTTDPSPTANDVATSACIGSTVDLTVNEAAINGGAVTYSYFEEVSLTTAIGDPTNVTINSDTTFFVLVDDGSCTDTAQIAYTADPLPTANDVATNACLNAVVDLTANEAAINGGAVTYSYFEEATLTTAIGAPTAVTINSDTTFFVLVDDGTCQDTAAIAYTVVPLPTANDVAAGSVCTGTSVDLTANEAAVNGGAGITYSYFEDAATTTAIGDPTNVTINSDTTFFVLVNDGTCNDTAAISYTADPLPTANDVALGPVCPSTVVDLTANEAAINGGAVTYSYFEEAALTTAIGDPTNVTINSDTTFFVLVDDGTCTDTAALSYTVNTLPTANDVATSACIGSTVDLTANEAAINGGAVTYSYFEEASLTTAIGDPTNATINSDTTFFVLVDDGTCTDTAAIAYTADPLPAANDVATSACIGSTVDLTANEAAINGGAVTYSYFEEASLTTAIGDPTNATINSDTTFFVLVDDGTCQDTAAIAYTADPLPTANDVAAGSVCVGTVVDLTANEAAVNGGAVIYTYFEEASLTTAIGDPTNVTINSDTTFFVLVNDGTCQDTAAISYTADPLPTANDVVVGPVCPATVVDLTANEAAINGGAVTYSYFEEASLTTAIGDPTNVTINSDTTFFVLVDDGTCQDTAAIDYTVNPLPTANDVAANACIGSTVDLTANEAAINGGAVTYSYFEEATLTTAIGDPTNVTINSDTTFFVLVDDGTCTDTAAIAYTADPLPTANDVATNACTGSTVDLTANEAAINGGAVTYSYFEEATLTTAIGDPTNVTINSDTTFFVLVDDGTCQDTAAIAYTADPLPAANDVAAGSVCVGTVVDLTANEAAVNGGAVIYTYFEEATLTTAIGDPTNATINSDTTFFVLVNDGTCQDTAAISYTADPLPTANDVAVGPVCPATVVDLTANEAAINGGAVTYSYFEEAALTTAIGDPTNVTINSDTTFFVLVDDGTCQDTAAISYTVNPLPAANDVATNACIGSAVDLTANEAAINGGAVTYSYFEEATLTTAIGDPTNVTINSDTTFFVLVDDGTCQDTAAIAYTADPLPTANDVATNACTGSTVDLTANEAAINGGAVTYSYFEEATLTTAIGDPTNATINSDTTFFVLVDDGTCQDTAAIAYTADPLPTANDVAAGSVCVGTVVDLTANEAAVNGGAVTYSYFEEASLTTAIGDPTNVTINSDTTFFVLVNDGTCQDTAAISYTADPLPTANDVVVGPVCPATVVDLTANEAAINGGAVTYSYFEEASLTTAIGDPTNVTINSDTTFFVLVDDGTCQDTAALSYTVNPLPAANDVATSDCIGSTVDLTANEAAINGGAVTYSYFEEATLTTAIADPTNATINSDTTFFVLVDDGTCTDTAAIAYTADPLPAANDVAAGSVCVGTVVDLTANEAAINGGAVTYSYFEESTLATAIADPTSATITSDTTFFVLVDDGSCQDTAQISYTADPLPAANDVAAGSVCVGTVVDLTANEAAINGGAVTYSYFEESTLATAIADPTSATITSDTTFFVLVNDGTCQDTAQISYTADPLPAANDVATSACTGAVVDLTANEAAINGGAVIYTYFEESTLATAIADPTNATITSDTTFFVLVDDGTCQDTAQISYTADPLPAANDVATSACTGAVVDLTANEAAINGGAVTYSYFEEATLTTAIADPTNATINSDTTFFVLVDDGSCQDTAQISYTADPLPAANDVAAGSVCVGTVVDLTANEAAINGGAVTYSYFEESTLATAIADPTNATITSDTTFFVLVDDGTCQDTAQISYTADPLPAANDVAANVCTGSVVDLTANEAAINGGAVIYTYFEESTLATAIADPTSATITSDTTFFVLVDDGTCQDTAQISYTADPLPTANDVATSACTGSIVDLTANEAAINGGAVIYTYFEESTLATAIADPTSATITSDTTFFVLVDDGTCQDTAQISYTADPLPTANDVATSACTGSVVDLTANEAAINGGTVIYTYFEESTLATAIADPTNATITSDTTFFVLVDDGTCQDTAQISYTADPLPTANDVATSACTGSVVDLTANEAAINGGTVIYTYFEESTLATAIADPTNAIINSDTTFFVLVDDGSCQDTAQISYTADPLPAANDVAANVCTGTVVDLTANEAAINGGALIYTYFEESTLATAIADPTSATITSDTTFFVLVDDGTCQDTAQISYTADPLPAANDVAANVCTGSVVDLTANEAAINGGAVIYTYFEESTLATAIADPTSATITSDTTFFVLVDDGTCQDTAQISYTADPLPTANDVATSACTGSVVDLTANEAAINGGAVTYSYFEEATLATAIADPTSATITSDTTFFVLVDDGTCQDTAQISYTADPLPTANDVAAGACIGTTVDLTSNEAAINGGAVIYSYFEEATLTTAIADPTNVTLSSDSTFFVLVDDGTCQDTAAIAYTVTTLPTANDVAASACIGSVVDLTANEAAINGGAVTYSYFEEATLTTAIADPTNATINSDTTFFVLVDNAGCADTAQISYTADPLPAANDVNAGAVCTGTTVDLTANEAAVNGGAVTYSYFEESTLATAIADPTSVTITSDTTFFVLVDDAGCQDTAQIDYTVQPLPTANDVNAGAVCGGTIVDLTASEASVNGGAVTYSYFEEAALATAIADPTNVTVNSDTTFFVLVDDGTCQDTAQISYTLDATPVATDEAIAVCEDTPGSGTFAGYDLTSLDATVGGGDAVTWFEDAGLTTAVADPTNATLSDAVPFFALVDNGTCTDTAQLSVSVSGSVTASVSVSADIDPACVGQTVTFTATTSNVGASPNISWFINGVVQAGETATTFSTNVLSNGDTITASVEVTDASILPCIVDATVTDDYIIGITSSLTPAVTLNASATDICAGAPVNFSTTVSNVGTSPTYAWFVDDVLEVGETASTYSNASLADGQEVKVVVTTDPAFTCVTTTTVADSVTINVVGTLTPSLSLSPGNTSICPGDDVTFTATASDFGTTPSYQWTVNGVVQGSTGSSFTVNNITSNTTVDVTVTADPAFTCVTTTSLTESSTITVLPAADASCIVDCSLFIATAVPVNVTCTGDTDGKILIFVIAGGSGGYAYSIDGGPSQPFDGNLATAINNQPEGVYDIEVTDTISGCTTTIDNVVVSSQIALSATVIQNDPTCGSNDGQLIINLSGGALPYTYNLLDSTGVLLAQNGTGIFNGLGDGTYGYFFEDANGCTLDTSYVTMDGTIAFSITPIPLQGVTCEGDNTGVVELLVTGDAGPFEYSNDGSFTDGDNLSPTRTGLSGGRNLLFVRKQGAANCFQTVEVFIDEPDPIVMPGGIQIVNPSTCNTNDGEARINAVSGGTAPYRYFIDGAQINIPADSIITGLNGGSHTFAVEDANGCTEFFQFIVDSPSLVVFNLTPIDADCDGTGDDGGITVDIIAGNPPYFYSINNSEFQQVPANTFTIGNLTAGQYDIIIKSQDAEAGCPNIGVVNVGGPTFLDFTLTKQDVLCKGENGTVTLTDLVVETGTAFDLELYTASSTTPIFTQTFAFAPAGGITIDEDDFALVADEYQVRLVQSQTSCGGQLVESASVDFRINEPFNSLVYESIDSLPSLPDQPTGEINIRNVNGGTLPYLAMIELVNPIFAGQDVFRDFDTVRVNPATLLYDASFEELYAGDYEVEIVDANGCTLSFEFFINFDRSLSVPNIFTPNGDDINDVFFIRNLPANDSKLIISNRWGKEVYRSDDYQNDWDGEGVPDGVYFYQLTTGDFNSFTGWVEIVRGQEP